VISGRENYVRAIEFRGPEYLPTRLGYMNWLHEKDEAKEARLCELKARFPDDLLNWMGLWKNRTDEVGQDGVRRWVDEWGTAWADEGLGGRAVGHPLQDGFRLLESYEFPDPYRPDRFAEEDEKLRDCGDRYAQSMVWFTVFERLYLLRGFENALTDPHVEPVRFGYLRDKIVEINLAMIDQWLERDVDAIYFSDDWGTQHRLFISTDDWRRFYRPAYERLFRRAREGGAHVWLHSCGNITPIIPDLIELGVNVLNPIQPQAMDVRYLSQEFGGRLCFYGGVDSQGTLTRGTPEDVRREVHELVQLFGRFSGGYIGAASQSIMPETPLDNIIALFEAFTEYL
jgi:uroporphyrinogen decarboxylase